MRSPEDIAEEIKVISAEQEAQKTRAEERSQRLKRLSLEAALTKLDETVIMVDHDMPLKEMCAENGFGLWDVVGDFGKSVYLSEIKFPTQDAGLIKKRCKLIPFYLYPHWWETLEEAEREIRSFGFVPAGIRDFVVYYRIAKPCMSGPMIAFGSLGVDPKQTRWGARIGYNDEGYTPRIYLELTEFERLQFWMTVSSATFLVTADKDVSG